MTVTDADIAELETWLNKGRDDWIHGRLQWDDLDSPMAQADDATIFGPFGGIAPSGAAPTVRPDIQRQVASRRRRQRRDARNLIVIQRVR